jgi:hypothetical protein
VLVADAPQQPEPRHHQPATEDARRP